MSEAENKQIFRQFVDAINRGDWIEILKVWSPDMVHWGRLGGYARSEVTQLMGEFRTAFPDLQFHIEDLAADGDRLFARMTVTCTHKEDFQGISATGKTITVRVMGQIRMEDGKIVEHWNVMDELYFLNQLGAVSDDLLSAILV